MSNTRLFLFVALCSVTFLIWQQWQVDYAPRVSPAAQQASEGAAEVPSEDLPQAAQDVPASPDEPGPTQQTAAAPQARTVTVRSDVLELRISTRGGDIVSARLLDYPVEPGQSETVRLLSDEPGEFYVAQSGVVSASHEGGDHLKVFQPAAQYRGAGNAVIVPMVWSDGETRITKRYVIAPGSYEIRLEHEVENLSDRPWVGQQYLQLQRTPPPPVEGSTFTTPQRFSFVGPALYTEAEKYEKFEFDELDRRGVTREGNGWVAMVQHYFISAWVPEAGASSVLDIQRTAAGRGRARILEPAVRVAPGDSQVMAATLFVGPKLQDRLDDVAEGLALTVDYGVFTPFSKILFWLLEKIYSVVGNWGWAIVLLTVLVKGVFFKLTEAQYKSMAKMKKLQPRIVALKERYGDDKQKFNVAMMELYKKDKVNPLGGCLPVLIQIPVFIALYWVLVESVELRQAPFILWIDDLSKPDPYFVLPAINAVAMFLTTKLSPNPAADPIQQKVLLIMPLVFSVMFAFFQAGLVLYWAVNAVLSLAQQWFILRRIEAQD